MKTNRLRGLLFLTFVILALPTSAAAAPLLYRVLHTVGSWFTPVPLLYANATPERTSYDALTRMLHELTRPNDHLVLVARDSTYCVFRLTADQNAVPLLLTTSTDPNEFAQFATRYQRVWVIVDDPRAGWEAQPPPALAATLASSYMALPLPLPTYFADASLPPGSTNFWLFRAHLLQRIATAFTNQLNPRFHLDLAQTYRRYGDVNNAIRVLQEGVTRFPSDPYLARRLAECYYDDVKDYRQAIHYNRMAARNFRLKFASPMYEALFNSALAYQNLGEDSNAQLQFNEILAELDQYPDPLWESRTRRYLGNLLLKLGNTNEAIRQFNLDLRTRAQHPGYSYDRVLALYRDLRRSDEYARTARAFFELCGSNDVRALTHYLSVLQTDPDRATVTNALLRARAWLARDANLRQEFRRLPSWSVWTNLMLSLGYAPEL